jgi:hypothetical protein
MIKMISKHKNINIFTLQRLQLLQPLIIVSNQNIIKDIFLKFRKEIYLLIIMISKKLSI